MVAINLDASVVVRFVDYGNTEEIHATSLNKLQAHLEFLPIKVNFSIREKKQFQKTRHYFENDYLYPKALVCSVSANIQFFFY